jgi:hypothetical protein
VNMWQFMSGSPWLTFFLFCIVSGLIFRIWNRGMRALNIRSQGWPPPHCDADGDFPAKEES